MKPSIDLFSCSPLPARAQAVIELDDGLTGSFQSFSPVQPEKLKSWGTDCSLRPGLTTNSSVLTEVLPPCKTDFDTPVIQPTAIARW
jgi:hypothetical protein